MPFAEGALFILWSFAKQVTILHINVEQKRFFKEIFQNRHFFHD